MIRAAIVGSGAWGRTLVDSVQGRSRDIHFVAACTRTPANAGDYCQARGMRLHPGYAWSGNKIGGHPNARPSHGLNKPVRMDIC